MTVRTTIHALLPLLWYMFMTRAAWRQPVQASVDSMILRQHANFMRKYERLLKLDQNYCRIQNSIHIFSQLILSHVRRTAKSDCQLRRVCLSICPPAWDISVPTERNFMKPNVPLFTYLLTPWRRALLEKLTGSAASQEIVRIFGTRRFITVLTSASHLSLS